MSKLFLSGGGDIEISYAFDRLFFDSLPQNAHILYIPVAMATTMIKKEMIGRHFPNWKRNLKTKNCEMS